MKSSTKKLAIRSINKNISEDPTGQGAFDVIGMINDRLKDAVEEGRILSLADIEFEVKEIIGEMIEVTAEGLEFDDILNDPSLSVNPMADAQHEDDDETWTDPAGGIHYKGEKDPAKQYE